MMDELDDNRIFDRFTARFPVKFKGSRRDFGSEVFLRDVSAQGAKLVTSEQLEINDSVSLQVKLPDGNSSLHLNGQIVWTQIQSSGAWEIGLKFHRIKLMSLQKLFQFCQ